MFTQTSTRERITHRGTLPPAAVRAIEVRPPPPPRVRTHPVHGAAACELCRPAVARRRLVVRSKQRATPGRAQPRRRTSLPPRQPDAWPRGAAGCAVREPSAAAASLLSRPDPGAPPPDPRRARGEEVARPPDLPLERFVGNNYGGMSTGGAWRRRQSKQDACDGKND
jgi:hypothetical protein